MNRESRRIFGEVIEKRRKAHFREKISRAPPVQWRNALPILLYYRRASYFANDSEKVVINGAFKRSPSHTQTHTHTVPGNNHSHRLSPSIHTIPPPPLEANCSTWLNNLTRSLGVPLERKKHSRAIKGVGKSQIGLGTRQGTKCHLWTCIFRRKCKKKNFLWKYFDGPKISFNFLG